MPVRQHGGLEGFHTANNCTPDFTGAAASRPNGEFDPQTFPQISARTAFQLMNTKRKIDKRTTAYYYNI